MESKSAVPAPIPQSAPASNTGKMTKVYIVFYSMYGHVHTMAKAMKEGAYECNPFTESSGVVR